MASAQYMQRDIVKFAVRNPVHYDVAISFLELWSLYYLVDKVNAEKKYHGFMLIIKLQGCLLIWTLNILIVLII